MLIKNLLDWLLNSIALYIFLTRSCGNGGRMDDSFCMDVKWKNIREGVYFPQLHNTLTFVPYDDTLLLNEPRRKCSFPKEYYPCTSRQHSCIYIYKVLEKFLASLFYKKLCFVGFLRECKFSFSKMTPQHELIRFLILLATNFYG
mgnify:CR=1 FL=1